MVNIINKYGYLGYCKANMGNFWFITAENVIYETYSCRDNFRLTWENFVKANPNSLNFKVGFIWPNLDIPMAQSFWNRVFEKLPPEAKFELQTCNFPNAVVMQLPEFWNRNETVRSLFTLLLRASIVYHKGNFNETFSSYGLMGIVKTAVFHFIEGNTKPTYQEFSNYYLAQKGFIAEFQGLPLEQVKLKLVKP